MELYEAFYRAYRTEGNLQGSGVTEQCNLVWLENLNLRGDYKKVIFDFICGKISTSQVLV